MEWLPELLTSFVIVGIAAWIRHVHNKVTTHTDLCVSMNLERAKYEADTSANLRAVTEIVKTMRATVETNHDLSQRVHHSIDKELSGLQTEVAVLKTKIEQAGK